MKDYYAHKLFLYENYNIFHNNIFISSLDLIILKVHQFPKESLIYTRIDEFIDLKQIKTNRPSSLNNIIVAFW